MIDYVEKCRDRADFLINLAGDDTFKHNCISHEISRVMRKRQLTSTDDLKGRWERGPALLHDLEALRFV